MSLKLMYITNNPSVARIAQDAGVDRIFIDMEYIGKEERQAGLDTVKSHHTTKVGEIRQCHRHHIIRSTSLHQRFNLGNSIDHRKVGVDAEMNKTGLGWHELSL